MLSPWVHVVVTLSTVTPEVCSTPSTTSGDESRLAASEVIRSASLAFTALLLLATWTLTVITAWGFQLTHAKAAPRRAKTITTTATRLRYRTSPASSDGV